MAVKNEMIRKKQNYKVNNWPEYNLSLKKRGSLEVWISDGIEELWYEKDIINDGTGKPKKYTEKRATHCSGLCILNCNISSWSSVSCAIYSYVT